MTRLLDENGPGIFDIKLQAGESIDLTPRFERGNIAIRRIGVVAGSGLAHIGDDNVCDLHPGRVIGGITTRCVVDAGAEGITLEYQDEA